MPRIGPAILAATLLAALASTPRAEAQSGDAESFTERLDRLQRESEELSAQAEEAVKDFLKLVGPMIERLSALVDDLPAYEAPEILPNGDIIMRRKRDPETPQPDLPQADETET